MRSSLALAIVVSLGCSGSDFDVAEAPDSSSVSDTGSEPLDTGSLPDVADAADTAPTCGESGPVTDVWVDANTNHEKPNGTAGCPFRSIVDALAFVKAVPGPHKIQLRPGTYTETALVQVPAQIAVVGAGAESTNIMGGASCGASLGNCVVRVESGGSLEGVTVHGAKMGGHAIATGAVDKGAPVLKNLRAIDATADGAAGIVVIVAALIGPNVEASKNSIGLQILASGNVATRISGGNNRFDNNAANGVVNLGNAGLSFVEGGSVSGNGADGMRFGETVTTAPQLNFLSGVTVKGNGGSGVRCQGYASLKLRGNSIIGNKIGVIALYGTANGFDFGSAAEPGTNNFGSTTTRNSLAGVCALPTRVGRLPMQSNKYPTCPPTAAAMPGTTACADITAYADVWYRGGSVPDTTTCSAGS